jgi:hypothetical protein
MFVVDNVMAFYTTAGSNADPRRGFGSYLSYTPVWQKYLAGNSSSCIESPGSCPCLDKAEPCVKQGDALVSLPDGSSMSWYATESFKVSLSYDFWHGYNDEIMIR